MKSVEDYTRQWTNRGRELKTTILSEQVKVVDAIKNLKNLIGQRALQQHQSPRTQHVAKHLSQLHDKACCYPFGHIYCLINGQGIDNSVCNPTFTPRHLWKSWKLIGLFCIHLTFQPKMKNWILRHPTHNPYCISVLTNSIILLCMSNAP